MVGALVPGHWSTKYVSSALCDSGLDLSGISDWSSDEQVLVLSSPTARRHAEET